VSLSLDLLIVLIAALISVVQLVSRVGGAGRRPQAPPPPRPAEPDLSEILRSAGVSDRDAAEAQEALRRATAQKMGRTLADDVRDGRLQTRPEPARTPARAPSNAPARPGSSAPPRPIPPPNTPRRAPRTETRGIERPEGFEPRLEGPMQPRSEDAYEGPAARVPRPPRAVQNAGAGAVAPVKPSTVRPDTRDIVQALIWSEVLGAPRSRRPRR
jgi:hypothetical protein